jgi:anti-sigma factor RsiW
MKSVEPAELSAYIDGELESTRRKEIEAALERDASLRAELEELTRLDAEWSDTARSAISLPPVQSVERLPGFARSFVTMLIVLLVLRFVPKVAEQLLPGVLIHIAAFALVLVWIFRTQQGELSRST